MGICVRNIVPEYPVNEKTIYFPDIELVKRMKILLLGSGGREHALAWKISQSPKVEKLYIAPGNAGTREVGENVALSATDFEGIKAFVLANGVDMVFAKDTVVDRKSFVIFEEGSTCSFNANATSRNVIDVIFFNADMT